jgi:hypothetical protein
MLTTHVCSACAFHSDSATWDHVFAAYAVYSFLNTLSGLIGFAQFNVPVLSPQTQNRIQIP